MTEIGKMSDPDPRPAFGFPVGPWHDWFAWRPVRTYDNRFCWFLTIRRRRIQRHDYLAGPGQDAWWQYHCEVSP